jgi:hypothetical protein
MIRLKIFFLFIWIKNKVNDKLKVVSSSKRVIIKPDLPKEKADQPRELNTREIKSLINRDITDHGDGLISLFKYHEVKIKLK